MGRQKEKEKKKSAAFCVRALLLFDLTADGGRKKDIYLSVLLRSSQSDLLLLLPDLSGKRRKPQL